jgi:hypothetical protein
MKWWYGPVFAILPPLGYLAIVEALYRWLEAESASPGTGWVLGRIVITGLIIPGYIFGEFCGEEYHQYWVQHLSYAYELLGKVDRKYVEWQVPVFTTAALIYIVGAIGFIFITYLAKKTSRK